MKTKKQIDYSKVPEAVFQKDWELFRESLNNIEGSLESLAISLKMF
jgi:hypothetical protein